MVTQNTLRLLLGLLVCIALSACATEKKTSNWTPKVFVPMPEKVALVREQSGEVYKCSSKAMHGFACMSLRDLGILANKCPVAKEKPFWKFW